MNEKWPPINVEAQRQKAIDSSAADLASLPTANLALGLDVKTIIALAEPMLKPAGIEAVRLIGEQQVLHMEASFNRTIWFGGIT